MGPIRDTLATTVYERLLAGMLEQAAAYALSILRNQHDAEDAVQQAALRGLERIAQYDPRRPFRGWWFTVLRHCCLDLVRSRRPCASLVAAECSADRRRDGTEWHDLAEALDVLEPQQSEILRLRYFGGLSYDELAQALDIPEGTVMSRLHYARKALSCRLKDSEP